MVTGTIILPEADGDQFISTLQFGSRPVQIAFIWPRDVHNIYLRLVQYLLTFASNNPIVGLPRNYDALSYWLSAETYEEFLLLPNQPVKSVTAEQWEQIHIEMQAIANDALYYEEQLVWSLTIADWLGDIYQCTIRPGAWINNTSTIYRFRFVSDRTNIGPDELPYVSIEYEVYDA